MSQVAKAVTCDLQPATCDLQRTTDNGHRTLSGAWLVREKIADQLVHRRLERPEDHAADRGLARDAQGGAQIAAQVGGRSFRAWAAWEAQLGDQDRLVELEGRQ